MLLSSVRILSVHMRICLRMFLSSALASSAISSSERIQRSISRRTSAISYMASNIPLKLSAASSSETPYLRAPAATFNNEHISNSSDIPSALPTSRALVRGLMSLSPAKEMLPCLKILDTASDVCLSAEFISSISIIGCNSRHSLMPGSDDACDARRSVILLYSSVLSALLFIGI